MTLSACNKALDTNLLNKTSELEPEGISEVIPSFDKSGN